MKQSTITTGYNKNIILNYLFKILSLMLSLIAVRLLLSFMGDKTYGVWVTITSIAAWMGSGDLGIGNGLRNNLADAFGKNDKERQSELISTSIHLLVKIALVLLFAFVILGELLVKFRFLSYQARSAMHITTFFFCINLVLGSSHSIAFGYQKSWLSSLTSCEDRLLIIIIVLLFQALKIKADLTLFAVVYGVSTLVPSIILFSIIKYSVAGFHLSIKAKPNSESKKNIMSLGVQFFILQLCGLILYSTDSVLINKFISSEMVTKYNLITKVYDTGNSLFSILLIALWSAVTYYYAQSNYSWIKSRVKNLIKLWGLYSLGVWGVSILFNNIISIWIGNNAPFYENSIIILFAMHNIMIAFSAIFVNVINGLGRIKLQLIVSVIAAIINIPLSIIFAVNCNLGIFGIKLGTFACQLISSVAMPIQAILIMKKWPTNSNN